MKKEEEKARILTMPQPNEKQREFFLSRQRFIAYGGARGGGKSWAVRYKAMLLALHYGGIRILLMRRSFPELRENHILPLQSQLQGLATWKETDKAFIFPNGSRIKLGYCDSDADVGQYQGQEYDIIFIDEATHFSEYQFACLTASLRGANAFPKRMYLTCNPGGVGHAWVKRLFIDRQYRGSEKAEDYAFIPATVYDNPALLSADGGYVSMLENLPDPQRKAWLNGDWNIFAGQYFSMWQPDMHIMQPFSIPEWWRHYFTMDYGLDMLAAYWLAVDEQGHAYVYRELYRPGLTVGEAAELVRSLTAERIDAWYAPPDLWNTQSATGKSTAEIFFSYGIPLVPARNDRIHGWRELAEWLQPRDNGHGGKMPAMRVFANCVNLIRTLPQLQFDERCPNDCAKEPHELTHAPDAIRYFCAGRPRRTLPPELPESPDMPDYERQVADFLGYGG